MKKYILFFTLIFLLFSCTSNTIFKKPDDLIPKDTMQMLITDMIIASSARYQKNKFLEKNINYMPLIYNKYKIDSARFDRSNTYYISRIDEYQRMTDTIKSSLKRMKQRFSELKKVKDSLEKDSIKKVRLKERPINDLKKN